MSTLNKKGYEAKTIHIEYHVNWDGRFSKNGNPLFTNIKITNKTITDTDLDEIYQPTNWVTYLYGGIE